MPIIKDGKFTIRTMYICPYEGCRWSGYYDQKEIDEHSQKHLSEMKDKSDNPIQERVKCLT